MALSKSAGQTSYADNTGLVLLTLYDWKVMAKSGSNWVSPASDAVHLLTAACL